jgi:Glycoside-hydrolase family GH114
MMRTLRALTVACLSVLITAMTVSASGAPVGANGAPTPRLPPVAAGFDYQLGGAYPPPGGVRVVTRDVTARPAPHRFGICYVNAFQTQPGVLAWWKRHHPRLLLRDASGALMHDPGWPGEVMLDTSSRVNRSRLAGVIGNQVRQCARKGYQSVEPDNLDSFNRSKGLLTRADNLRLAARLRVIAHRHRLSIAQKNLAGLPPAIGRRVGFDFAVAEDCQVYDECWRYTRAFGRHVIEIEYSDEGLANFRRACAIRGDRISLVYRDRNLVTPGNSHYVFRSC